MNTKLYGITIALCLCTVANAAIYHVDGQAGSDANPGTNWATAKQTIQAGCDAATYGDLVLVNSGTYVITNQIVVTNGIQLKGAAGQESTIIDANSKELCRCMWVSNVNAVVEGFTLRNGRGGSRGGALLVDAGVVKCCIIRDSVVGPSTFLEPPPYVGGGVALRGAGIVENCTILGNRSVEYGGGGAGVSGNGTLRGCLITENSAGWGGAGCYADGGTIDRCTITRNFGDYDVEGGVYLHGPCHVVNCIIYSNAVVDSPDANWSPPFITTMTYCCTWPLPSGAGNIAADPLFVGPNDFRLQAGSPCIDAGDWNQACRTDLDGKDCGGVPDMGAYESGVSSNIVTLGYAVSSGPHVDVLSVSNRTRSGLVDITYRVTDSDSPLVEVRGLACSRAPNLAVRYWDDFYPLTTLVEGTTNQFGAGLAPSSNSRMITWDSGVDIGQSSTNLRVRLLASDTNALPISLHFVTIPADTNGPSFKICRYSGAVTDSQLQKALLWALLKGSASRNGTDLIAVGGTYDSEIVAQAGYLTDNGKLWLADNLAARLATADEVRRAREASTPGFVNKMDSHAIPGMKVNQYGVETTENETFYFAR